MIHADHSRSVTRVAYRAYDALRKIFWSATGGRREAVFGLQFRFSPSSSFPAYRGLRLPSRDIFSTIVRHGDYVQLHSSYVFLKELKRAPVVVDVGAHHGIYAVILGKLVQQMHGKVIAVGPSPEAFSVLQTNVRLNGLRDTVFCERAAIMDRTETVGGVEGGDQSRIAAGHAHPDFVVEAMTLKQLLKKYDVRGADLLIIDVEGAELKVLKGIDWKMARFGRIFCELHPYNWSQFGYTGADLIRFLSHHGYRCFDMYLREHKDFPDKGYIGPTIFVPKEETERRRRQ